MTIATRPRSKTSSRSLIFAPGDSVSSSIGHRGVDGVIKSLRIVMHFHEHVGFIENADHLAGFVDDRHLRNIGGAHPLQRGEQSVVRTDGDDFARFVAMGDEIAQVALGGTPDEALLGHPEIVVHLREVFVPVVGHEGDDALLFGLCAAITQAPRRAACRSRSRPEFLPSAGVRAPSRSFPRRRSRRRRATRDMSAMSGTKSSPMPSTAQLPAVPTFPGLHLIEQDRAGRIGQDHFEVRLDPREETARAR